MKTPTGSGAWWAGLALAALWTPLAWRLAPAWSTDPELAHGWAVPALALYLVWDRRVGAPPAQRPRGGAAQAWAALALLGALGVAAALPVLESNPSWPAAGWVAVTAAVGATLAFVAREGGLRRATFYAAPVVFAAAALPWPTMLRVPVALGLADLNAVIAAELVSAADWPALVKGRVIEVGTGLVGVDEACSGVRSLQTVAMVTWFFVVLFQLHRRRAAGLVAAALGVALAVNLARTCCLTWLAAARGVEAMDAAHDAAGELGRLLTLGLVALLAWVFSRAEEGGGPPLPESVAAWPTAHARGLAWALIAVMVSTELGTRAWYARDAAAGVGRGWELVSGPAWVEETVPEKAREVLGYSRGQGLRRAAESGELGGRLFLFHWGGEAAATSAAFLHDPTICLPSVGWTREAALEPITPTAGGPQVQLEAWRFRTGEQNLWVFFARWDGRGSAAKAEGVAQVRWRQVREGRRRADLYQLIVAVEGAGSDEAAAAEARKLVAERVRASAG